MATITKPMALDESFNTTEVTSRNQADVLASIENAIREGFGQVASGIEYDNTESSITATNVQDAIDEVDGIVDGIESDIQGTQSVSGNLITLTDAAPIYAEELSVDLEPIQDLHGYDKPWVGGAGKNKLPVTLASTSNNGITYSVDSDGIITASGTLSGEFSTVRIYQEETNNIPTGDYILSGCPSGYGQNLYLNIWDSATDVKDYGSGVSKNLVNGRRFYVAIVVRQSLSTPVKFKPMLRLSTETDPTFAPYSNISPIQGYDIVSVDRCGKNLFDGQFESGYYGQEGKTAGSGWERCTDYIKLKRDEKYILSGELNTSGTYESNGIFFYTDEGEYIAFALFNITSVNFSKSFTTPQNCGKIGFYVRSNADIKCIQLEEGETATTYEPYNGQTVSIQLGQTVYGGQLTLNDDGSAVFVGDRACADLGSLEWNMPVSGGFSAQLTLSKSGICSLLCSVYKYDDSVSFAWNNFGTLSDKTIFRNNSQTIVYCKDTAYTDATTFKTAVTGQQLVYELATPFTIHLSAEQLQLLQGTNNVWSNAGDVTLKYQPDNVIAEPKADVQRLRDDVDAVARDNYSENLLNNDYYKTATYDSITGSVASYFKVLKTNLPNNFVAQSFLSGIQQSNLVLGFAQTNGITNGSQVDRVVDNDGNPKELTINYPQGTDVYIVIGNSNGDISDAVATTIFSNYNIMVSDKLTAYKEYIPTNKELWEMIKALQ